MRDKNISKNNAVIIEKIRRSGLKATPQRIAVYTALKKLGHSRAEDIFSIAQQNWPALSVATLYSALNSLATAGLISRIILKDNCQYFDITTQPHSHFVCKNCYKIWDIDISLVPYSNKIYSIAEQIETVNIVFYGICKNCKTHSQKGGRLWKKKESP